jgi:AraC family transcriptional regulator
MKTLTREHYARRIERVTTYLIDHLDAAIDLHRLAEEAHLSAYHFHRVYRGMTGETIAETVRRMRLHRAAVELISSAAAIEAIANRAGYGSAASFNRAFREAYQETPAAYREKQSRALAEARNRRRPASCERQTMYTVSIEHRVPERVVALHHAGDYMNIGMTFEKLTIWAAGQGLVTPSTRSFGIYYDDPAAVRKAELRADACIALTRDVPLPPPYREMHTPGGRCALLVYKGPYSDLEAPYAWLFGTWLPASGEEPAHAPSFEEYLNDARTTPPSELLTAICLPLK